MSMSSHSPHSVILCLGNPLMGDDGLGLAALARLRLSGKVPAEITVEDGGTWGLNLLPVIESANRLLIIDAIRSGQPPGTLVRLEHEDLPRYLAHKLSPHEVDLKEILALSELRGTMPETIVALGIEPAHVELAAELTPIVASAMDLLVDAVYQELARWGYVGVEATVLHA